jgi:glycosyltransferase involved in cell wall biosynthesis
MPYTTDVLRPNAYRQQVAPLQPAKAAPLQALHWRDGSGHLRSISVLAFGQHPLQGKVIYSPGTLHLPELDLIPDIGGGPYAIRDVSASLAHYGGLDMRLPIVGFDHAGYTSPTSTTLNTKLWQSAGELSVMMPNQKKANFAVLKQTLNDNAIGDKAKLSVYLITDAPSTPIDETYIRQFKTNHITAPKAVDTAKRLYQSDDPNYDIIILINRLYAQLAQHLVETGEMPPPEAFVMHHKENALFPELLAQTHPDVLDKAKGIYVVHHRSDFVEHTDRLAKLTQPDGVRVSSNWPSDRVSSMAEGLSKADVVWADPNYAQSVKAYLDQSLTDEGHTDHVTKNPISTALGSAKLGPFGSPNDTEHSHYAHYGIGFFDPTSTQLADEMGDLQVKGASFTPLTLKPEAAVVNTSLSDLAKELKAYKHANKLGVYQLVNHALNADERYKGQVVGHLNDQHPDKTLLFLFNDRIDTTKGHRWVLDAMKDVLAQHKSDEIQPQFIVSSTASDVDQWHSGFKRELLGLIDQYPGQVAFINGQPQPSRKLLMSGADIGLKLAFEEPFGRVQFEMMRLGTPVIYHNVDGLKTTLDLDPPVGIKVEGLSAKDCEALNVYTNYHEGRTWENPFSHKGELTDETKAIQHKANTALVDAMNTALAMPADQRLELSARAMQRVETHHNWEAMSYPYLESLKQVLLPQQQQATTEALQPKLNAVA